MIGRRRFPMLPRYLTGVFSVCILVLLSRNVSAQTYSYDFTKTVIVNIGGKENSNANAHYAAHAFAGDKHHPKDQHKDTAGTGALIKDPELTEELLEPDTDHGHPRKTAHLKLVDKTFVQKDL